MGFLRKEGVKEGPPQEVTSPLKGGPEAAEGAGPRVLSWAAARALGPTQAWPLARDPPRAVEQPAPAFRAPRCGHPRKGDPCPGEAGNF